MKFLIAFASGDQSPVEEIAFFVMILCFISLSFRSSEKNKHHEFLPILVVLSAVPMYYGVKNIHAGDKFEKETLFGNIVTGLHIFAARQGPIKSHSNRWRRYQSWTYNQLITQVLQKKDAITPGKWRVFLCIVFLKMTFPATADSMKYIHPGLLVPFLSQRIKPLLYSHEFTFHGCNGLIQEHRFR